MQEHAMVAMTLYIQVYLTPSILRFIIHSRHFWPSTINRLWKQCFSPFATKFSSIIERPRMYFIIGMPPSCSLFMCWSWKHCPPRVYTKLFINQIINNLLIAYFFLNVVYVNNVFKRQAPIFPVFFLLGIFHYSCQMH